MPLPTPSGVSRPQPAALGCGLQDQPRAIIAEVREAEGEGVLTDQLRVCSSIKDSIANTFMCAPRARSAEERTDVSMRR